MKIKYEMVLKTWNSAKQTAEIAAIVGKPASLNTISRKVAGLNKYNKYTFGGFGKYYDFQRATN